MDELKPGDEVVVTTTGTVQELLGLSGFEMQTPAGNHVEVWFSPDQSVVVLPPDRLSRADVIETHQLSSVGHWHMTDPTLLAWCRCNANSVAGSREAALRWHAEHVADELSKAGL